MSANIVDLDNTSFDSTISGSSIPVLVDFWAEWCGPCKTLAVVLDQLAIEYDGKLKIVKVNVDKCSEVPQKYNIRGLPTLILFKGGDAIATKVGVADKAQLVAFLDQNM